MKGFDPNALPPKAREAAKDVERLRGKRQFHEAHSLIDTWLAIAEKDDLSAECMSILTLSKAFIFFNQHEPEQYQACLDKSLRLNPLNINARLDLCDTLIRQHTEKSLTESSRLIEATWDDPNLWDVYEQHKTPILHMASKLNRHLAYYLEEIGHKAKTSEYYQAAQEIADHLRDTLPRGKAVITWAMAHLDTLHHYPDLYNNLGYGTNPRETLGTRVSGSHRAVFQFHKEGRAPSVIRSYAVKFSL